MRHTPLLLICLLLVACGGEEAQTPAAQAPEKHAAGVVVVDDKTTTTPHTPAGETDETAADTGKPPADAPTVLATWRGEGTAIEFNTWKMGCSGCSNTVQKRLGKIDGIEAVTARVDQAFVHVDIDDATKRAAIISQITKALEEPATGRKFKIVRAK